MERLHRTHREEGLTEEALTGYYAALDAMERWDEYYNYRRPHSAIKYLVPADYYRGNPDDRKLLAGIAKNDEDFQIRKVAIGKIDNKALLAEIADSAVILIGRILEKGLGYKRLIMALKKMRFTDWEETQLGISCKGREGAIMFGVSAEHEITTCVYMMYDGKSTTLVRYLGEGKGEYVGTPTDGLENENISLGDESLSEEAEAVKLTKEDEFEFAKAAQEKTNRSKSRKKSEVTLTDSDFVTNKCRYCMEHCIYGSRH